MPSSLYWIDADAIAAWERAAPSGADDAHARIVLLSPPLDLGAREVIPSWGADVPPGSWIEIQLRAHFGTRWSRFYRVAAWDAAAADSRRHSFESQRDEDGQMATDTLALEQECTALQVRVLLCAEPGADMPDLEYLALCLTGAASEDAAATPSQATYPVATALAMPLLVSQYTLAEEGWRWCSPTALTMALSYWHSRTGDVRLAPFAHREAVLDLVKPLVYDPGWEGSGNWGFNTAAAATLGLRAYVTRLHSLSQLARWLECGVPLLYSIAWEEGELANAPIRRSSGHISMLIGLEGELVVAADPAGPEEAVLRRYRSDQFLERWQAASGGAVYVIHPLAWPQPAPGPGDAWPT